MLEILADEAGFLLDKRLRNSLEQMPPEDAQLQKAELLLQALGVQEEVCRACIRALCPFIPSHPGVHSCSRHSRR